MAYRFFAEVVSNAATVVLENRRCREIPISNNVGGVKHDLSTRRRALEQERHFALIDGLRFPPWARF
jgi:hypothetical protein